MGWYQDDSGAWNWVEDQQMAPVNGTFSSATTGTGPADANGNPITTNYNQSLFADDATAQRLATALGGTVTSAPLREAGGGTPGSTFTMPNANYVVLPNGAVENAGTLASWANQYGTDSPQFQQMLSQELAWDAGSAQNGGDPNAAGADYWYQQYTPASSVPTPPPQQSQGLQSTPVQGLQSSPVSAGQRISPQTMSLSAANRTSPMQSSATAAPAPGRGSSLGLDISRTGGSPQSNAPSSGSQIYGGGTTPTGGTSAGASAPVNGRAFTPISIGTSGNPASGGTSIGTPQGGGVPNPFNTPPGSPTASTGGTGSTGSTGGTGTTGGSTGGNTAGNYPGSPGFPNTPASFPTWQAGDGTGNQAYVGGDPGYMASALQNRALDYGNQFQTAFGNAYTGAMGQSQAYQGQADQAYNWLNQNPGYSADETNNILQQGMLTGAMTTPDQYASNFLTPAEQSSIMGNAGSVQSAFNPNDITNTATAGNDWTKQQYQDSYAAAKNALASGSAATQGALSNYATNLRGTVDPTKLGISDQQVAQLKDQAGRQIGLNYAAQQDQLQRQAEAAGNVNPLALSANRQRLSRQSAIDNADAVTNADIAATGAQRAANTTIAGMQQSNENSIGNAGLNTNLSLTGLGTGLESAYGTLGANVGATANAQQIGATTAAGNTAIDQAKYVDTNNAARAAALATNRQTTAQANQANAYQQGYNTSNALSGRYQGVANQRIQGQQAARNYWQGQGQFQGTQANTAGSQMISGAQTALNGQAQGANTAMGTEIGRRSTRPVTISPKTGIQIGI